MSVTPSSPEPAAPRVPGATGGEPGPLGEVDRSERALSALTRILNERHTQLGIARRSGHDLPPASWALREHLSAATRVLSRVTGHLRESGQGAGPTAPRPPDGPGAG
ncbi:hypothetical protein GCM10007147_03840 [Nocardiopsis kunsanensis]|uniref:Uncharacterized protein n=1 Tax=Nocardiopsis kunsanensis TaxID=141693 RepID=A0A918X6S2_9ACTN|nr:hypothetical protein [Nocardiopsis kunsanensis]GHD15915.1 hypothetical protein GCM10007147_03840 [Nocardiopsis kunsanensis]